MAANEKVMGALHDMVATVLTTALKGQELPGYTDPETGEVLPPTIMGPSAAIIQAATKFLKDNEITCAPSSNNALGALEDAMKARKAKRASALDLRTATDQHGFLTGLPN